MMFQDASIKALVWPDDSVVRLGENGVAKIEAVPVEGSAGYYPWFIVEGDNGFVSLHNSLHLATVQLATPPEGDDDDD